MFRLHADLQLSQHKEAHLEEELVASRQQAQLLKSQLQALQRQREEEVSSRGNGVRLLLLLLRGSPGVLTSSSDNRPAALRRGGENRTRRHSAGRRSTLQPSRPWQSETRSWWYSRWSWPR